jgi:hypothetical protein
MAGRIKGYRHDENTRSKIQGAALINRLHAIAMGDVEASAAQVNAAKTLLNKILPDLQSIESTVDIQGEMGIRSITVEGVASKNA